MTRHIADILAVPRPATLFRSERDELIQTLTDRLNAARKGTKWKPLTCRAVAIKTAHLSLTDLRDFEKDCRNAASYSAYFFWALKPTAETGIKDAPKRDKNGTNER